MPDEEWIKTLEDGRKVNPLTREDVESHFKAELSKK
jgi:hypothetical protein